MLIVLIGLGSALVYGAADFLGGLAARRISAILTTAIGALTGLVLLALALPILGGTWSTEALVLGGLSGVVGAIAIGLLYASLAIGPMSILSPLTAVVSAIVPLTAGLLRGETFGPVGLIAIALALVAVVLVGFVPEKGAVRPSLKGILMAVGSGTAIGVFLIVIDLTPDDSGLVPLLANRVVNATIMFAIVGLIALRARMRSVASPEPRPVWRTALALAIGCGVLDVTANVGLLIGLRLGELSVLSVLAALYPAGTIILAAIVLKERIAPVQYVGLALALTASAMLALA